VAVRGKLNLRTIAVFWHVTPCGSCKNRLFAGTYCLHQQGDKINNRSILRRSIIEFLLSLIRLLVTAEIPISPIPGTLLLLAICSSETAFLTRATRRSIQENVILHSNRREDLKSHIALTGWALQRKRNVSPVRYERGVYIPEDGILHSRLNAYTYQKDKRAVPSKPMLNSPSLPLTVVSLSTTHFSVFIFSQSA
jgi:hypothetical protein